MLGFALISIAVAVPSRRRDLSRNNLRASKEDPPHWSRRGGKVRSLGEETRRAYHRFASTLKASTPLPDRRSSFGQAESRCVEPSVSAAVGVVEKAVIPAIIVEPDDLALVVDSQCNSPDG
jgi:hypothetical protein